MDLELEYAKIVSIQNRWMPDLSWRWVEGASQGLDGWVVRLEQQ